MINPYSHKKDKARYLSVNTHYSTNKDCDDDDKHAKVMRCVSSPMCSPAGTLTSSGQKQQVSLKRERSFIRNALVYQTVILALIVGIIIYLNASQDAYSISAKHNKEDNEGNLEKLGHQIVSLSKELNEFQKKTQIMEERELDTREELRKIVRENRNDHKLRGGNNKKENEEKVNQLLNEISRTKAWLQKHENIDEDLKKMV